MNNNSRSTLNDNTMSCLQRVGVTLTGEEDLQPPQSSGLLIGLHAAARVCISTEQLMHHVAAKTPAVEW